MRTTFQLREFPVDLRLKLRVVSEIEKKPMHEIVEKLVSEKVAQYATQIGEMMSLQAAS